MTQAAGEYLRRFTNLLLATQSTNGNGDSLDLDMAMGQVVDRIRQVRNSDGVMLLVGNGGSAAIASHMQNDISKAAGIKALVFTEQPLLTALTNDNGYDTAFEFSTNLWAAQGDLMIAISSSGSSENILRASRAALNAGANLVTMSGFKSDNPLRSLGQVNLYVTSSMYGQVETAHAALGHYLTDAVAGLLDNVRDK